MSQNPVGHVNVNIDACSVATKSLLRLFCAFGVARCAPEPFDDYMIPLPRLRAETLYGIFDQFLRFAGVGIIGTICQYLTLITLVTVFRVNAVLASTLGFVLGGIVNYYLNYHYTFHSKKGHQETSAKFFTVAVLGLAMNGGMMHLGTEIFSVHYIVAQVVATGVVLIWNFLGNRLWTFASQNDRL